MFTPPHIQRILLVLLTLCNTTFLYTLVAQDNKDKIKTIVIDPGHGGEDPGAVANDILEKDLVLAIALKLGSFIKKHFPDVKIIYTRDKDIFIPLHERADIANKNHADLFISIHGNASTNPNVHGAETYALGLHKSNDNLEIAKRENSVILKEKDYTDKYEGFNPTSVESYIMFSLMQYTYLNQSLEFAWYLQNQFRERIKRNDRGVKQAGFLVLWKTSMPSVLIEVGYITNKNEAKFLQSEIGQDYIASAIFRAFSEYKDAIENRSRFDHASRTAVSEPTNFSHAPTFPKKNETTSEEQQTESYFCVQILATKEPLALNDPSFKGLKNVNELFMTDTYKYVIGKEKDYNKIVELRNKLKTQFPDAFIIAIRKGQIIPVNELLNEQR